MNINCCRRADCADHNCPGRDTDDDDTGFHWETTLENFGWFLAGIGFLALCVALLVLLGGWR